MLKVDIVAVGMLQTNCYIVYDTETLDGILIDPGGHTSRILARISELSVAVKAIFATHGHFDHLLAVPKILAEFPVPLYVSPIDCRHLTPVTVSLADIIKETDFFIPFPASKTLTFLGREITVYATPGHSKGSVSIQIEDLLFTGDTLFPGSCGRTDFIDGDSHELRESLLLLASLPGSYTVYPGHGPSTTLSHERQQNPYMRNTL